MAKRNRQRPRSVAWKKKLQKKVQVQLCWSGYSVPPIHRRDPTTARHEDFCLLRFRPGPVRPSLDNLDTLASAEVTILMPSLVRTPDRHRTTPNRTPDLKPSTKPGLQAAGLQEYATTPSRKNSFEFVLIYTSLTDRISKPFCRQNLRHSGKYRLSFFEWYLFLPLLTVW